MGCKNVVIQAVKLIEETGTSGTPQSKHNNRYPAQTLETGFAGLDREIREFVRVNGINGRLPTSLELKMAGRADLARIIRANGGFAKIANCLGLRYIPQPRLTADEWMVFQQTLSDIRNFVLDKHLDGRMPLYRELRKAGMVQVAMSIIRFGGFDYFASWLGLVYEKHPNKEIEVTPVKMA